jgi:peptidoglycan hydrolase CwlO-like protein
MGLKRIRTDSVKDRRKQKSMAELQKENEQLTAQVQSLETQLEDTQMALCDVYELVAGGGVDLG